MKTVKEVVGRFRGRDCQQRENVNANQSHYTEAGAPEATQLLTLNRGYLPNQNSLTMEK
jgi:hypothetical protein